MTCEFIAHLLLGFAGIRVEVFFLRVIWIFRRFRFFRETYGRELLDGFNLPGTDTFTLCLIAFDGNELFGINLF